MCVYRDSFHGNDAQRLFGVYRVDQFMRVAFAQIPLGDQRRAMYLVPAPSRVPPDGCLMGHLVYRQDKSSVVINVGCGVLDIEGCTRAVSLKVCLINVQQHMRGVGVRGFIDVTGVTVKRGNSVCARGVQVVTQRIEPVAVGGEILFRPRGNR